MAAKNTGALQPVIEVMRIHHWIKNFFVFASPLFARQLTIPSKLAGTCAVFAAFCLASSASYALNDLLDAEQDRIHPRKRNRPIAAGRLSPRAALYLSIFLAAASLLIAYSLANHAAGHMIAAYIGVNLLYSLVIKHWVILDVMTISAGFILRILAGALAAAVAPSYWLVLCTLTVSLFLGFTKRRAEIVGAQQNAVNQRKVLDEYSPAFLDQMINIVTGATLVCYILYTVDARTVATYGTHGLLLTIPFVLYGLFRYLYLAYHKREGESPTRVLLSDIPFQVNIILWVLVCVFLVYWGKSLPW